MQTLRICLAVLLLLSCNQQKTKQASLSNEKPPAWQDSVELSSADAINFSALTDQFSSGISQQFIVPEKKISRITAKNGVRITVDPSKLVKEDGSPVDGKIKVEIIELVTSEDLFKSNAATVADGRLLVSGGSYFVGMSCNGDKLKVRPGEELQVSFPMLKKGEMELFYGERDAANAMNWRQVSMPLQPASESVNFSDNNIMPAMNWLSAPLKEMEPGRVYRSLNEPVYYYRQRMTLGQLVDSINKTDQKVYLQTISFWPKNLPTDKVLDTHYLVSVYGPRQQYILRNCKMAEAEERDRKKEEEWSKQLTIQATTFDSLSNVAKAGSLTEQVRKYYAPAYIKTLGWINCDRYYNAPERVEMYVNVPTEIPRGKLSYFIIYKNFNGLVSGVLDYDESKPPSIGSIPKGEPITLVAFIKNKGLIYECKEDLIVSKGKRAAGDFKLISAEELTKIFGNNVRI